MIRKIVDLLRDDSGVSELIGSFLLLLFVIIVIGSSLQNLGHTGANVFEQTNNVLQQQFDYLNHIP